MTHLQRLQAVVFMAGCALSPLAAQDARQLFNRSCSSCHGQGGSGGDRAPSLTNNRGLRTRSEAQIHDLIRDGTPGGMPGFPLAEADLRSLAQWIHSLNVPASENKAPGDAAAGRQYFSGKGQCNTCHMVGGQGKVNGPDLTDIGSTLTYEQLNTELDKPGEVTGTHSSASCPSWAWCPENTWTIVNVHLRNGSTLRGFARGRGLHDLQLQTSDGKIHLLRDSEYDQIQVDHKSIMPTLEATPDERRNLLAYLSSLTGAQPGPLAQQSEPIAAAVLQRISHPQPGDWPSYNGHPSGNRYSGLDHINTKNVEQLQLQWTYSTPYPGLQNTPVVLDGVMYVTGPNHVCALDAGVGREIWCYTRPNEAPAGGGRGGGGGGAGGGGMGGGAGLLATPSGGNVNRGVAVLGDQVFFTTDNAHLISLNRLTGGVVWDVTMPQSPGRYAGPGAPLVVGNLVLAGHAGGDGPLRGFLAAYEASTGKEAWRFWIIPKRGEPGSETWKGTALETGGGATWLTGSYDAELGLVYWPTGNPYPTTDGDQREGDNLYTDSVVALDAKTGALRWHYQFTPHDLHDYDATEPLLLVDAQYLGKPRKLLLQANRNGFFYVLDRTTGELLLGKPFVNRLTWADGIGPDGKPRISEKANKPTPGGTLACPAVRGATNWYSTAFSPVTKLFYVMAVEDCNVYRQGRGGYVPYRDPSNPPEKYLRAINIETGKTVWEVRQVGAPEANYSGVLASAGGLVFYGETGGGFAAVDAKTGKTLWHFETGQAWKASPMTYMLNGRQFVATAVANHILSFALPQK